jgi:hypothetical protein
MKSAGEFYKCQLRADRREIRTLSLFSGQPDEDVRCSLQTVSLNERPKYIALSYVWGDPKSTKPISVNGKTFDVTTNLESALRHIRKPDADEVVWADAICISQADIEERNQQVRLIGAIYSEADKVVIWLGEADYVSDLLATIITEKGVPSPPDENVADYIRLRHEYSIEINKISLAFLIIATRPWWTRVWVIQECVLSSNEPVFQCGMKSFSWTKFFEAFDQSIIRSKSEGPLYFLNHPSVQELRPFLDTFPAEKAAELAINLNRIRTIRQDYLSNPNSHSLCSTIFFFVGQQATVAHDYVYGFLGMVSDEDSSQISVDYRLPCWDLYRKVMEICLTTKDSEDLELLSMVSFQSTSNEHPSWIPDFSSQVNMAKYTGIFLAYPYCWRSLEAVRFSDSGDILMLEGVYLDVVSQVYPITQDYRRWRDKLSELEKLAKSAVANHHSEYSAQSLPQDLFRLSQVLNFRCLFTANNGETTVRVDDDQLDFWWNVIMEGTHESFKDIVGPEGSRPRPELGGISLQTLTCRTLVLAFQTCNGRCLITTKEGLLGIGMPHVQPGDVLVYLFGMNMPWILRPRNSFYTIVGGVYVGGLTDLSVLDRCYELGQLPVATFRIR